MILLATASNPIFEAFKAIANFMANPAISFLLVACGLMLLLALRRYVFNVYVGAFVLIVEAVVIIVGMKDPNFYLVVGKADNVPIVIMLFLSTITLWLAMSQAVNNERRAEQMLPPLEKEESNQKTWVWPDLLYIEFIALILCTVALIIWAIYLRAPLEQPANPSATPNPSKAPWYFLGLQEMLVYYDPWYAGVVLPIFIIIGLCALPYIDTNPKGNGYYCFHERKFSISIFLFGYLALWVFMIITGTFLRGPGWNFFGPFEYWDPHKVVALNNNNLSDYVWIKGFKQSLPEVKNVVPMLIPPDFLTVGWQDSTCRGFLVEVGHACRREFAGILFLGFYFLVVPLVLAKTVLKKFYESMDFIRFSFLIGLILMMGTLPLKMFLRWTVNLKYFIDTPWIKF